MTTNEILQQIYRLQPTIHAWTKTARPNILWSNLEGARMGIMHYVGPQASPLVLGSFHISGEDRQFLLSWEALNAIWEVVAAIYNERPLNDGYLPEEADGGKAAQRQPHLH